jgi:hypothetical protein
MVSRNVFDDIGIDQIFQIKEEAWKENKTK